MIRIRQDGLPYRHNCQPRLINPLNPVIPASTEPDINIVNRPNLPAALDPALLPARVNRSGINNWIRQHSG